MEFDFVYISRMTAAIGLVENSEVTLVASMLISPLMVRQRLVSHNTRNYIILLILLFITMSVVTLKLILETDYGELKKIIFVLFGIYVKVDTKLKLTCSRSKMSTLF